HFGRYSSQPARYAFASGPEPELAQVVKVAPRQRRGDLPDGRGGVAVLPEPVQEAAEGWTVGADRLRRGAPLVLQVEEVILDGLAQVHEKGPFLTEYQPVRMRVLFRFEPPTLAGGN